MWCATRFGWFSIASAQNGDGTINPNTLMIRARARAHLLNLQKRFDALATLPVKTTPQNDYRYRIFVPKEVWAKVMVEMVMEQEWSNFKREAARFGGKEGRRYSAALHEVWATMYRLQQSER